MDARETTDSLASVRPLLRWAGGKQRLVSKLVRLVPSDFVERRYVEPFLGAASLYLALRPKRALLSDANPHLMSFYNTLKCSHHLVAKQLRRHSHLNSEAYYYRVRRTYNLSLTSVSRAAAFIYLNRTSFNGIFRVNRSGHYNVPYGFKDAPLFPSTKELSLFGRQLTHATLRCEDYTTALMRVRRGDFVYLDPPYPPLNGTSFFAHYTADRFTPEQHDALARHVRRISKLGCIILMTNADTPEIRKAYKRFQLTSLSVTRNITCKAQKHRVRELVITNY